MTQLSDHFKSSEFACKCGCGEYKVNPELIDLLEDIRAVTGPVMITSGRRCEAHNRACGGKEHSQHLLGNAADIHVNNHTPKELAALIERRFNPKGMGVYSTFVHVDVRPGARARW
jgi:uncharacterized protein YcbK (DUF882 family)